MKFIFDEQGYPFLDVEYEYHVLADFLSGDVQSSLYGVNEYLSTCDDVTSGKVEMWSRKPNTKTASAQKLLVLFGTGMTDSHILNCPMVGGTATVMTR